jgi:Nucleoside 2-deoxyribosyltransferase
MKIYLASPFFDQEQVERVKRVEAALEQNPTVTEVFSPRLQQDEHLEHGSDEWREFVYNNDIKHVEWCDAVVAVHDYIGDMSTRVQVLKSATARRWVNLSYFIRKKILRRKLR